MVKYTLKYLLVFIVTICCVNITVAQKKTKVQMLNSNYIRSDKNIAEGARRLIGDVVFKQDSTIMKCDSAYFYSEQNMFEAFGSVHLYKVGDKTVDIKSNFLRHNGNTKMAQFRKNVVMSDTKVVLYTDSLDYDIKRDIGYYEDGAKIVDSATTLTSLKGHYYHHTNEIFFKKNVVVVNNEGEYEMYTDTLKYNTKKEIAYFLGPTEFFNDTNYMYSEFGWYNTTNNKAFFKKKAIYKNQKQSLTADSLYYDRDLEHGIAYSNVVVTDTAQNLIIKGNYLEVFEDTERLLVTDKALLIHIIEGDSLFLHADTIISEFDTSGVHRTFKAFYHTRIYKSNLQAQTDSLFFSMFDSVLQFHGSPVFWAEKYQITADYIEAFIIDDKLNRFKLYNGGLIVSQQDSTHFNQIKGTEMTGFMKNNALTKIDVYKKSETISFPFDEYGILGANKGKSGNITIMLKENKISRIIYRQTYEGKMHPLADLTPKEMVVRDFVWLENIRPKSPEDVFKWEDKPISETKGSRLKGRTSSSKAKNDSE